MSTIKQYHIAYTCLCHPYQLQHVMCNVSYKIVIPCFPPLRKIIDYLHVQADNPWYNYNLRYPQKAKCPKGFLLYPFFLCFFYICTKYTKEPRHVISNNVFFFYMNRLTQTSLCSLLLSLVSPNAVLSVD